MKRVLVARKEDVRQRKSFKGSYMQEMAALVCVVFAFYLLYALLLYGSGKGALVTSFSLMEEPPFGNVGLVGFLLASLLLYLFGTCALAVPMIVLIFLHFWIQEIPTHRQIGNLILFLLLVAAMMIVLAGHAGEDVTFFICSGGVVGAFFYDWLVTWCGEMGTALLLGTTIWCVSCYLLGICLLTRIIQGARVLIKALAAGLYGLMIIIRSVVQSFFEGIRFCLIALSSVMIATMSLIASYDKACRLVSFYLWGVGLADSCSKSDSKGLGWGKKSPSELRDKYFSEHNEFLFSHKDWSRHPVRHQAARVWRKGYYLVLLRNSLVDYALFVPDEQGLTWQDRVRMAVAESRGDNASYVPPSFSLFTPPEYDENADHFVELCQQRAHKLEEKLSLFGIKGVVVNICPGPVITLFEYRPESTSKISKITALEDDLALALTAHSIRIIAPIPGRDVVGFEIANQKRRTVRFAEILLSSAYENHDAHLPLILGVDVVGQPVIVDLVEMPHLLIGGTTGSGKSVGMNTMLMSLLCCKSPDELRLILIDPKRLEFSPYADIAHLHFPIVTEANQAARVLAWLVQEMERRYELLAQLGVRNVVDYELLRQSGRDLESMPFMVLMIDELADLMMVAAKEVETSITRLAQMARAAGIHIMVATQRPSVDVVTGIIKVNFPSRVSFRVSSKVDSRTIIDRSGSEKLLGKGDMLFMHATASALQRIHGCYLSQQDIERYTKALRAQAAPTYLNLDEEISRTATCPSEERDELYDRVVEFIKTTGEVSISLLQRHYRIGFNRSARIIEQLEMDGLITPTQGSKPRKVIR